MNLFTLLPAKARTMRFRLLPLLLPFCAFGVLAAPPKPDPVKDLPDGTEAATKRIPQLRMPAGMKAELWAAEPKLASPVAISVDEKGRVFVAEEYRLGKGAAENRSNPAFNFSFFLEDDLQIRTLDDRLKAYRKWQDKVPGGFGYFTANADQVRRLEDTTGSGRADKSTIFTGGFHNPLDGLCAGVLARDGDVFVTNIPSLYKLKDTQGAGVADVKEELLTGFGVNIAFYGHDLHGLIFGPDGKIYFSVGDRGFNVTSKEGKQFVGPRTGGVFRCNPDGTEFEVVHRGLRNPQELAFDEHGNLFADDNNCDKGDHARLVYAIDGGETGWNMAYQTIPEPYLTGPWHAERLWHLPHAGQAAYITPPVGKIGTGPSGFLFTSGTSLPKRYENAFIMCNYTGIGGLEAFKVKEKGAGFEIDDYHDFLKPIMATDAEFGPDGKLYVADFVDLKWNGGSAGGRIYTVFDPELLKRPVVAETQKLFADGFDHRDSAELSKLLAYADQRIRQRAQFALAKTGAKAIPVFTAVAQKNADKYARLHAIWGLGQVAAKDRAALAPLLDLLGDADPEVQAQAAKVLGDRAEAKAADKLLPLLGNGPPRVKFFAAQAVGKLKLKEAGKPLFQMLQANGDVDPFLREGAVIALARIGDADALTTKATDANAAVRMGAVLALRKLADKRVALFLNDHDLLVRTEAARAIHDLPLESEYPALAAAKFDNRPLFEADALLRRVVDANHRLGGAEHAKVVLGIALNPNVPAAVRLEAMGALKDWAEPGPRDRVTGFWRPLPKRDAAVPRAVVEAGLTDLFAQTSGQLQTEAVAAVVKLDVKADESQFADWVADGKKDVNLRGAALRYLADRKSKFFADALAKAQADESPLLRAEARDIQISSNPAEAARSLSAVVNDDKAALVERQRGIAGLARLKDARAVATLDTLAVGLTAKTLPEELVVDVWDALKAAPSPKRDPLRKRFEDALPKDPVGKFQSSLTGGDAARGRDLFFNHTAAQCVRCHKVDGVGGVAGPELAKLVQRNPVKTREYILESLVLPSAKIAEGYASVTLTLLDGRTVAGVVQKDDGKTVTILPPDGKPQTIPADDIDKRTKPESPMPAVDRVLTPREMRDLVEFLSGLK